jgi:tRNA(fMet)-specific endonuclease VapC
MGLIFDTSELILAERQGRSVSALLSSYDRQQAVGISAVTVAEMRHGIRRAKELRQSALRKAFLDDVLAACQVYPLTVPVAIRVGDLDAEQAMIGERLDLADLIIVGTTLELGFTLVTRDLRHFPKIPALRIFQPSTAR